MRLSQGVNALPPWMGGTVWVGIGAGEDYPHRDVTEAILLAAIRVQKALGPGLLEDAYKVCLAHALRLDGHKALRVVVEAKAIEKFSDVNFAQLNSYLHFSSFEVGLLLDFHNWPPKDGGIKRIINTRA